MNPLWPWCEKLLASADDQRRVRTLFLRSLGFVYFCAFASLWPQILGLIGSHGILPVHRFLEAVAHQVPGASKYHLVPTLCWLSASNSSLVVQCALGTLLAIMLVAGLLPRLILPTLWLLWLSLTVAGQDFLGFQWENLLLETGLLAIFLAPPGLRLQSAAGPPRIILWLLWWLIFRLMFLSGMVKLLSGDPAWRYFTALFYHYETQPLPTPLGWYAYQLPTKLDVAETGIMYLIELGVPFLIFVGRRWRIGAAFAFVFLQLGIALTGNYGYFNLLTVVLCLPLLDDSFLARWRRVNVKPPAPEQKEPVVPIKVRKALLLAFAIIVGFISFVQMLLALRLTDHLPAPVVAILRLADPFRCVNNYGLFAVMTKSRPEIILEGSNDGQTWAAYEFKYKPGDLQSRPKFVAPYQPRLDWQMWFAALSEARQNPWFINFCLRLLEGEPAVTRLLAQNPFVDKPPKYLRAELYEYEFTSRAELRQSGAWWNRKHLGSYFGPISRKE